jgi:hypothetical protein
MRNAQVGDIIIYTNGMKMKIVGTMDIQGNREFLLVCIDTWEVHATLQSIDTMRDLVLSEEMQVEKVIPGQKTLVVSSI